MENNVVVCTDSNYSKYIPVLFESVILNTTKDINFYVIYSSIDNTDIKNITKVVSQKNNFSVLFIKFDFLKEVSRLGYNQDFPSFRGGYDAYSRIFLTSLLKSYKVKYCLYLDIDTIVNNNIDELFDIQKNIKYIGGVIDTISIESKIILAKPNYINSGVLILNLFNLEKFCFAEKSLNFAKNNLSKLVLPDQDIINNVFPSEIDYLTVLDTKFNMYYSKTAMVKSGSILHYTGPYKPWMPDCRWRLKKCIWVKYALATKFLLKDWKINKTSVRILGLLINNSRLFLNLKLQICLFLRKIKDCK